MSANITIAEIARNAGVGTATVDRVLNGRTGVNSETERKVLQAIDNLGTPIVTRSGRSYISRMAGSLLQAVGLPELATDSLAGYERLAVTLGRQPARVASYKRYLAESGRSSPLFDLPQIVRDIEAEFERLALLHRG